MEIDGGGDGGGGGRILEVLGSVYWVYTMIDTSRCPLTSTDLPYCTQPPPQIDIFTKQNSSSVKVNHIAARQQSEKDHQATLA